MEDDFLNVPEGLGGLGISFPVVNNINFPIPIETEMAIAADVTLIRKLHEAEEYGKVAHIAATAVSTYRVYVEYISYRLSQMGVKLITPFNDDGSRQGLR